MKEGITPATLIAAIMAVLMTLGIGGALVQSQIANVTQTQRDEETVAKDRDAMLLDRIKTLEEGARNAARHPVEKETLDAIVAGIDAREALFQAQSTTQITDLNRQFAAALLSINSNIQQGEPKKAVLPP